MTLGSPLASVAPAFAITSKTKVADLVLSSVLCAVTVTVDAQVRVYGPALPEDGDVVQFVPVPPTLTCTVGYPAEMEETAVWVGSVNVAVAPPVPEADQLIVQL